MPPGTAHGDYNKPNVSAPAASVVTANGLGASGTSVASPIVAGIAAQLIARLPSLALRPEATRALIMAGAVNRTAMPDGSLNADHEGTGSASAMWANSLLAAGDAPRGGHRMGSVTAGQTIVQEIAVIAGQRIKVVVAWNSRSDGATDRLMADLDLRVFDADGSVDSSLTFDNNYEWVEFIAGATGTARIEVRQSRFEDTSERYGLAWAKSNVGTPDRLAGADRYSTAATLSWAHFPAGVPVAFVATGRNFPDALAVGPVAGMQGGPVLLTDPNSLPQATRDELARLQPGRIVIAGGPGAVSDGVAQALQAYTSQPVSRLAGADRYETAAAVSRASFGPGVPAAFIATGRSFPDALAAGPAAIRMGGPVLLTQTGLAAAGHARRAGAAPASADLRGGRAGVVGDGRHRRAAVVHVAGGEPRGRPDRYATAAAISSVFFGASQSIYLATGTNYPDALAAVPGAGRAGSPLLLVRGIGGSGAGDRRADAYLATAHLDRRRHGRHRRRGPAVHHVPARKAVRRTALATAALLVAAAARARLRLPVPTTPRRPRRRARPRPRPRSPRRRRLRRIHRASCSRPRAHRSTRRRS